MEKKLETLQTLSKSVIAAARRVALTTKRDKAKVERIEAKILELQEERAKILELISMWEAPIEQSTGFNSEEILTYLENPEAFELDTNVEFYSEED